MIYLKLEIEINDLPIAVKTLDSTMILETRYKDEIECTIEVSVLGEQDEDYRKNILLNYLIRLAKNTNSNIHVL